MLGWISYPSRPRPLCWLTNEPKYLQLVLRHVVLKKPGTHIAKWCVVHHDDKGLMADLLILGYMTKAKVWEQRGSKIAVKCSTLFWTLSNDVQATPVVRNLKSVEAETTGSDNLNPLTSYCLPWFNRYLYNLQHCRAVVANLCRRLDSRQTNCIIGQTNCIQELYTVSNKFCKFNKLSGATFVESVNVELHSHIYFEAIYFAIFLPAIQIWHCDTNLK